jgi:hypothetical protein
VKLGDIVVGVRKVEQRDPVTGETRLVTLVQPAIYGDRGPHGAIGEGSIKFAQGLGVNADPVRGGTDKGIEYFVFPGSGEGKALSPDEIQRRGDALMAQLRGHNNAASAPAAGPDRPSSPGITGALRAIEGQ